MPGANDGVLIFVSYAVVVCKSFGEPVCGANEGCLRIDVLGDIQYFLRSDLIDLVNSGRLGKGIVSHPRVAAGLYQKCSHSVQ